MTVAYVIHLDVQPDQVDRFLALLDGVLDAMRQEENFREAILHRDPDVPGRFMLYEAWADHEDVLQVQLHRPYRQAYHDALPSLLASPRRFSIWKPVRADRSGDLISRSDRTNVRGWRHIRVRIWLSRPRPSVPVPPPHPA